MSEGYCGNLRAVDADPDHWIAVCHQTPNHEGPHVGLFMWDEGGSTVSGFSPEAVQAAAKAFNGKRLNVTTREWVQAPWQEDIEDMTAALAAAWATDFGDPSDYQGADHE